MTKYAVVGNAISYSLSPVIHNFLINKYLANKNIEYSIWDFANEKVNIEDVFSSFDEINKIKYKGLNITMPYKDLILKLCEEAAFVDNRLKIIKSKEVEKLHAANWLEIYKDDNNEVIELRFANTDILGLDLFIKDKNILENISNILILGSGQTGLMCSSYFQNIKDKKTEIENIYVATQNKSNKNSENEDVVKGYSLANYSQLNEIDYDLIINTTPLGQGKYVGQSPLSYEQLLNSKYLIDYNYSPYATKLIQLAKLEGITTYNGLELLINQAVISFEMWFNIEIKKEDKKIILQKLNKKLIKKLLIYGMPLSGKTTLYKELLEEEKIDKSLLFDLDLLFVEKNNCSIADFVSKNGIQAFRNREAKLLKSIKEGIVFCGGGTFTECNTYLQCDNDFFLYLDESYNTLSKRLTSSEINKRPLLKNKEDLKELYNDRKELYENISDYEVQTKEKAKEFIYENFNN